MDFPHKGTRMVTSSGFRPLSSLSRCRTRNSFGSFRCQGKLPVDQKVSLQNSNCLLTDSDIILKVGVSSFKTSYCSDRYRDCICCDSLLVTTHFLRFTSDNKQCLSCCCKNKETRKTYSPTFVSTVLHKKINSFLDAVFIMFVSSFLVV